MGRKIKLEFEEVAGYPQMGSVKLTIDGKEMDHMKDGPGAAFKLMEIQEMIKRGLYW
jgi:hypothetical protein